jgi:hypothetical protein
VATQHDCPAGSFCVVGSSAGVLCPIGSLCASARMTAPTACTAGKYKETTGTATCTNCAAGTASAALGAMRTPTREALDALRTASREGGASTDDALCRGVAMRSLGAIASDRSPAALADEARTTLREAIESRDGDVALHDAETQFLDVKSHCRQSPAC